MERAVDNVVATRTNVEQFKQTSLKKTDRRKRHGRVRQEMETEGTFAAGGMALFLSIIETATALVAWVRQGARQSRGDGRKGARQG